MIPQSAVVVRPCFASPTPGGTACDLWKRVRLLRRVVIAGQAPDWEFSGILRAVVVAIALTPTVVQADSSVPPGRFTDAQRKQRLMQALPQIETLMSDRMRDANLPGLAYGVVIDDEVVLTKGLGLRDVAAGAKVDAKTVFRIASMTKSFTALAILKLRDAGKLRLDDPVNLYLPELRKWTPPTKDSGPITIRQLLGHTAGFPEDNPQNDRVLDITPEAFSAWVGAGVPFSSAPRQRLRVFKSRVHVAGQRRDNGLGPAVPAVHHRRDPPAAGDDVPRIGAYRRWLGIAWRRATEEKRRPGQRNRCSRTELAPLTSGLMTSADDLGRFVAMMLSAYPPRDDPERAPAARRSFA